MSLTNDTEIVCSPAFDGTNVYDSPGALIIVVLLSKTIKTLPSASVGTVNRKL